MNQYGVTVRNADTKEFTNYFVVSADNVNDAHAKVARYQMIDKDESYILEQR